MKKLRVILSAIALVSAVGGTFVTQANSSLVEEWEYIPNGEPFGPACVRLETSVCGVGDEACTINNHIVGNSDQVSSQCGTELDMP